MKIDRSRIKKSTSEVPLECQQLIEKLQSCDRMDLLHELSKINNWTFGKCELFHWAPVLDIFDGILQDAGETEDNKFALKCDIGFSDSNKHLLLWILHFSTLLIEHSFSRHLYNSMEHLLVLLQSNDMAIVLGVLNLLYMFSKRSNFITRLKAEEKNMLTSRLVNLAENWGGKENGFGLADCCDVNKPVALSATTLHVEFHKEEEESASDNKEKSREKTPPNIIHIENVDQLNKTPAEIMNSLLELYYVPPDKEMWLFAHVRLAHHFGSYKSRLLCVQARLQALSILVYSNSLQDSTHSLLYTGLLDELVELVELSEPNLVEIRAAALRTLTAIIHLDRSPHIPKKPGSRLHSIIDVTGASQFHGFLPSLVRSCITSLTKKKYLINNKSVQTDTYGKGDVPKPLPVDPDQQALNLVLPRRLIGPVIIETKKNVFKARYLIPDSDSSSSDQSDRSDPSQPYVKRKIWTYPEYPGAISDETDSNAFPLPLATALFSFLYHLASYEAGGEALVSCGMMESLLKVINWHGIELEHITFVTRAVRVIDLITNIDMAAFQVYGGLESFIDRLHVEVKLCSSHQLYEIKCLALDEDLNPSAQAEVPENDKMTVELEYVASNLGKTCLPQRAALLKSMLNFLKKALQESTFSENIRHLMEGSLPDSLKNIIANAEYYGPSLFLLATDVVTVYVYQEPTLLSALQDSGLTDVVLHALLIKDVPSTREVLGSLPNVFSALCLNNRGLQAFVNCKPFEKFFKVLLTPSYLPAMRRRRSSEPMADTACNLGNAMDELMRHQPSLKTDATKAIVKLLQELVHFGTDPKYICWRPHSKSEIPIVSRITSAAEGNALIGSSDEEDDDEEEASTSSQNAQSDNNTSQENSEKKPVALVDYILNTMKFIDAILSNNSTDDHCREFVTQGGLPYLLKILGLPNLPVDCPVGNAAQAVATVCKNIFNLAHEPMLFTEGLSQLWNILQTLKRLYTKLDEPGGSKLLLELATANNIDNAFTTSSATPLLHAMNAAHGYVIMFVHVCRTGQTEIRNLALQHWGTQEGLRVLRGLNELYTALVWESTLLLAYCSEDLVDCNVPKEQLETFRNFFERNEQADGTGTVATAMEALSTNPPSGTMEVDSELGQINKPGNKLRYIKPLLGSSSRLGRALAELFGLLVKLSVGSPIRQRRGQNIVAAPPLPSLFSKNVASTLSKLLADGLDWEKLPKSPTPKCRLTFLICSVGFTSPMLFDEKRHPYHLMLKRFVERKGQSIFFKTFQWALSAGGTIDLDKALEHPDLPEGTGGFLDAWLLLLEKMINPKAVLDSPHVIPNQTNQSVGSDFTFDPVKYLTNIHRLAFDNIIHLWGKKPLQTYGVRMTDSILTIFKHILRGEKIIKDRIKAEEDRLQNQSNNPNTPSLASILGREPDSENLRQLMDMGFSRESACEALVHTISLEQATDYLLSNQPREQITDSDLYEDEEVLQAIAYSLGCVPAEVKQEPVQPLNERMILDFTRNCLDVCFQIIKHVPESVYKICELLLVVMKRNGSTFRDNTLDGLFQELFNNASGLAQICSEDLSYSDYVTLLDGEHSQQLALLSHLVILLFENSTYFDMRIPCINSIFRKNDFVPLLVRVVTVADEMMRKYPKAAEPKWLSPVLLLIDEICKVSVSVERKDYMHQNTNRVWRWLDLVTGKWTNYSTNNNRLINEAYWKGERDIRVTCGRRRYTVTFSSMVQLNEESGNNRFISMGLLSLTHPSINDNTKCGLQDPVTTKVFPREDDLNIIRHLSIAQKTQLIKSCVKIISLDVEKDVLHSILQICVRLTRSYDIAKVFVEEGGVKRLLNMKHLSDFGGYIVLATIIIKHTLEEPATLAYAMEKVIRGRVLPTIPPPHKELSYIIRQIAGAVTRCPNTFFEVAQQILRIDTNNYLVDETDIRVPIRVESPSRTKLPVLEENISKEVISDLLIALLRPLEVEKNPTSTAAPTTPHINVIDTATIMHLSGEPILRQQQNEKPEKKDLSLRIKRPMLPKSIILKILADAVVSYAPIAKLVAEFTYVAKENMSVLSFLFDKILPENSNLSDSECSSMCRMLIAAIASSNHAPEAQAAVVTEVKAALGRALLVPESTEKHTQIQQLCGIISTMIENCPPAQPRPKNQPVAGQMNNIVKLMMKKGLFNDLARIPHYIDLSSPNMPYTGNACLKPMESLSRIVNHPIPTNYANTKKKNQQTVEDISDNATTSTDGTHAQGDETLEDPENTEHDASASTLETTNNLRSERAVLAEIMERILDPTLRTSTPNRPHNMDIDEQGNMTFEHERDATEELMSTDSEDSDSNATDPVEDDENEDNDGDDENMDEGDENEDSNYDEEDSVNRRSSNNDDEDSDILMIHYAPTENDVLPRIRWNESGFSIPMFDELANPTEQTSSVVHPLLATRSNPEPPTTTLPRNQRNNRARRYQYLFNPRNPNPPVILQRLLGPHDPFMGISNNSGLGTNQEVREPTRVVVMDNFGLLPTHEEQINFVDQSGYLFGPSLAATLNYVPPVLHWWNIESRCLDMGSMYDVATYISNQLIPHLIKIRNIEMGEKKKGLKDDDKPSAKRSRKQKLVVHHDDLISEPIIIDLDDNSVEAIEPTRNVVEPANEDYLDNIPMDDIIDLASSESNDGAEQTLVQSDFADNTNPPASETQSDVRSVDVENDSSNSEIQIEDSTMDSTISNSNSDQQGDFEDNASRSNLPASVEETNETEAPDDDADVTASSVYYSNQNVRQFSSLFEDALTALRDGASTSQTENNSQSTQTVGTSDPPPPPPPPLEVISTPSTSSTVSEEIPEGVDPSFLAAIPPEMRREVLEQHRLLNMQQRITRAIASDSENSLLTEVNPEFLAALPPSLQEEVLTQQRIEQQRQAALHSNPDEPIDASAFFETLQPSLRTMILSDMEDSQISALPPEIAAEAQTLRRDLEYRNRQMVHDRFMHNNLTSIIRQSNHRVRSQTRSNTVIPQRSQWGSWNRDVVGTPISLANMKIRGRQLLDHEGLTCLLVLLFTDEPHLNKLRLHRVIRNLCFHAPTREWVVGALLSVIERSVYQPNEELLRYATTAYHKGSSTSKPTDPKLFSSGNWLNIRMEAALGCSANIFIVNKLATKRSEKSAVGGITIHPQAAPIMCKNALELFISLCKAFPGTLLPLRAKDEPMPPYPIRTKAEIVSSSNFWDMLLKLDSASSKKGKSLARSTTSFGNEIQNYVSVDESIFGQLLNMLASPVIFRSTLLTDHLLRLLSVITAGIPELTKLQANSKAKNKPLIRFDTFVPPAPKSINLAVNVLTYKSCSEEGLEYVTNLLLNLASASYEMSYMILNMLMVGAKRIGDVVRAQVYEMLIELHALNNADKRKADDQPQSSSKGTIANRFTKEIVIITASTKTKSCCNELQLPSMAPLTSKCSSQIFFLRVLRVIVSIHAMKLSMRAADPCAQSLPIDELSLSEHLSCLDHLWETLSHCLLELEHTPDQHAVLVLQPAVEAFFLVHSPPQLPSELKPKENQQVNEEEQSQASSSNEPNNLESAPTQAGDNNLPAGEGEGPSGETSHKANITTEQLKFLSFAERHRTVLNQILRQSTTHLADGPFSVLVDHTRILDFDIKRRYFRTELDRLDQSIRREETAVHVRRSHIFEDSFRELYRRTPEEWKNRFYIVFEDEEGQDAGGLLREWYVIISRDIFNPMYALFTVSPGDRVTYMINSASHYNPNHLCYYKFVGRVIAKAIYDNKLLECYFTRSFYKHILGIPVKYTDMESEDYSFYNSLVYLMENNINNLGLDLTFSTEINEFGVTETRDLIPNGRNVPVTEDNKMQYIRLSCQMKMTGAIKQQLHAFLEGFYDIIPMRLISIFNEQELELLISGLPNVDIEDLRSNTEYHKYQSNSLQIQWFWRALRSFDQADRAKFLQFVTGTSKVPLQGFGALEGMNGVQKFQIHRDDRSTDRLPSAHTCFNQLDLPVYETYDKLRANLLKAIHECSEGFGFA